jgi:hypothetical protein
MINGVSDYLLWPIRTLEQAQGDRVRWRRVGFFNMPMSPKFHEGTVSMECSGTALQLSQDARTAPQAAVPEDGLEAQREEATDLFR